MVPYTPEADAAWIAGTPATVPKGPRPGAGAMHPQVHALRHAAEQLKAARHWSHADPGVAAAYREAVGRFAAELAHHTRRETQQHQNTISSISSSTQPKEHTMAGETSITVIGNLTNDPELRFTPVSRGFGISDGVPCPNCGYTDPQ